MMSVISGLILLKRIIKYIKILIRKIKLLFFEKKMEKLRSYSQSLPDMFKCIICVDIAKNVVMLPCKH